MATDPEVAYKQPAEQQLNLGDPSKTGESLENLAKLKAQEIQKPERGGAAARLRAEELASNQDVPPAARAELKKLVTEVNTAGREWHSKPEDKNAGQKLDATVKKLKAAVAEQEKLLPQLTQKNQEITNLLGVANAKEAFQNVQTTVQGEKGEQKVFKGVLTPAEVQQLSLAEKKTYLKSLHEALQDKGKPEGGKAAREILLKVAQKKVEFTPRKWQQYAQEALDGKIPDSPAHAASWLTKNIPPMQLRVERYGQLVESSRLGLDKAGLQPVAKTKFAEFSTSESNEYISGLKRKMAAFDQQLANRFGQLEIQDKTEIQGLGERNEQTAAEQEAKFEQKVQRITQLLQEFRQKSGFEQRAQELENAMEKRPDTTRKVDQVAQLRQQVQKGETVGFLGKMKAIFQKKTEAANEDYYEPRAEKSEPNSKQAETRPDFARLARETAAEEVGADPQKSEVFFQTLGFTAAQLDQNGQKTALKLLKLAKAEAESLQAAASNDPQLRAMLEKAQIEEPQRKAA